MKSLAQAPQTMRRSGIREIMDLAGDRANVIHLEVGQPDFDTPRHIVEAACRAAGEGHTRYTPNAGIWTLREAIARKVGMFNGFEVGADQITVTPGAVCAMATGLMALADPGDEVLVPDPGWPNYAMAATCVGAVPVPYPLSRERGFVPDVPALEQKITERTKVILMNSPSNPTGAVFPGEIVQEMVGLAAIHDVYLMSDEVYEGFVFEGEHISPGVFDRDGRVVTVGGFSKSYAMTGWRVGYAVASREVSAAIAKLQEPLVSCASSVSQRAAEAALEGPQDCTQAMREAYRERRDLAVGLTNRYELCECTPHGAFYMLVDISGCGVDSYAFCRHLLEHQRVATASGATFGSVSEACVRISLAAPEDQLLEGLERLCRTVVGLRKRA